MRGGWSWDHDGAGKDLLVSDELVRRFHADAEWNCSGWMSAGGFPEELPAGRLGLQVALTVAHRFLDMPWLSAEAVAVHRPEQSFDGRQLYARCRCFSLRLRRFVTVDYFYGCQGVFAVGQELTLEDDDEEVIFDIDCLAVWSALRLKRVVRAALRRRRARRYERAMVACGKLLARAYHRQHVLRARACEADLTADVPFVQRGSKTEGEGLLRAEVSLEVVG